MGRFDKIFRVQNGRIEELSGLRFEAVEAAKQLGSGGIAVIMFIMAVIAAIIRLML